MPKRNVQIPARKPQQKEVARKNAKSVWAKAVATLMALTIAGCGDWDKVDPDAVAAASAKEVGELAAPPTLSKGDDSAPISTTSSLVIDKNVPSAPTPAPAPGVDSGSSESPQTAVVTSTPAPTPAPPASAPAPAPVVTNATPTPTPAPPPPPSPSATLNSVSTILADMQQMNDSALLNVNPVYGWAHGPGFVQMGNDPRGINTPGWWQASNPSHVNGNYLSHMLPWAVQFEGVGNSASNTRIHIRNLKAYVLSRNDGIWRQTHSGNILGGNFCPQTGNYYGCSTGAQQRAEPSGGHSLKPLPGMNFHGYFGGRQPINGPDVHAVFVTFQARLIVDNPGAYDDRSAARYLLHVGADYYPGDYNTVLMPAVAISRAKMLNNDWQAFNMVTVEGAGIHEPGGGMPMSQFLANPPPLD